MNNILLFSLIMITSSFGLESNCSLADKIKASLLSAAVGDMLGAPTEFIGTLAEIQEQFPPLGLTNVDQFTAKRFLTDAEGRKVAPYTDDTAMAILVTEALVQAIDNDASLDHTMITIALLFIADLSHPFGWALPSRAPGVSTLAAVRSLSSKESALKKLVASQSTDKNMSHPESCTTFSFGRWFEIVKEKISSWFSLSTEDVAPLWAAGKKESGGSGSVMRSYPFGIIFHNDRQKAARWAAEHSKITHSHPWSLAASAALAHGVANALNGEMSSDNIINGMIETARHYDTSTANKMTQALAKAKNNVQKWEKIGWDVRQVMNDSEPVFNEFQGWRADDAIAATVYAFYVATHMPDAINSQELKPDYLKPLPFAIILSINTPGDSDTIGTTVGALVGAYYGSKDIPVEWLTQLEGRDRLVALAEEISKKDK